MIHFYINLLWLLTSVFCVLEVETAEESASNPSLVECEVADIIRNSKQLEQYHSCQVILNDLEIENYNDPLIQLNDLRKISGDLIIKNCPELVRIESDSLQTIGKSFTMHRLTSLSLISFPKLVHMRSLSWEVIPLLSLVRFNQDITDIEDIKISDTSLTGFSGFQTKSLRSLDINNNRFLDAINCQVEKIDRHLHITSNGKNLQVDLPNLQSVNNVSINDVLELKVPKLQEIKQSISFNNNGFSQLLLTNLLKIGGTLSILENFKLNQIDLDNLQEINGGLMIINNSNINNIDFFPELQVIDGGLEIYGKFASIKIPKLKLIRGSVSIKNGYDRFDCNNLVNKQLTSVIRGGKIECSTDADFLGTNEFGEYSNLALFNASDSMRNGVGRKIAFSQSNWLWYLLFKSLVI